MLEKVLVFSTTNFSHTLRAWCLWPHHSLFKFCPVYPTPIQFTTNFTLCIISIHYIIRYLTYFMLLWHQLDGKRTSFGLEFLWRWGPGWRRKRGGLRLACHTATAAQKQREEQEGDLEACSHSQASSRKLHVLKVPITLPDITTIYRSRVQAHNPTGDVLHSNRHCNRKM